jgi:hypothetical protein
MDHRPADCQGFGVKPDRHFLRGVFGVIADGGKSFLAGGDAPIADFVNGAFHARTLRSASTASRILMWRFSHAISRLREAVSFFACTAFNDFRFMQAIYTCAAECQTTIFNYFSSTVSDVGGVGFR